jgi:hypothetical protein
MSIKLQLLKLESLTFHGGYCPKRSFTPLPITPPKHDRTLEAESRLEPIRPVPLVQVPLIRSFIAELILKTDWTAFFCKLLHQAPLNQLIIWLLSWTLHKESQPRT